jgi:hypothetical protein
MIHLSEQHCRSDKPRSSTESTARQTPRGRRNEGELVRESQLLTWSIASTLRQMRARAERG